MRRFVLLLIPCLVLGLASCGTPKPRPPESVVREAAPKKEPAFFDDLDLSREQRVEVLAIVDKLYIDFAEYDRVRLVLLDATVKQVRAGKLRRDDLLPLAEKAVAVFNDALPDGIAAMQHLHAALTKPQREQLVALFTEGRKLSEEERREERNNKINKILGLTTGQKATIYPALLGLYLKHWGVIGRFRSALHEAQDAFVGDEFKANELAIAGDLELLALGEVIFDALEIGMNNLTKEQQQTLAALLDAQLRSPNPTKTGDAPSAPKNEGKLHANPSRQPSDKKGRSTTDI